MWVMVDGREERHPEGSYYLDYRKGEKRVRISVGKNATATDAQSARRSKQAELNAVKAGLEILDAPVMIDGQAKHSLAAAIASYLEDIKLTKKPKTFAAYSTALNYFAESCRKRFIEDIDRRDMLKFSAFLCDEKDQSPRSVHNKFLGVTVFLKPGWSAKATGPSTR
jgi:integrase/recombinase XerD